MSLRRRTIVGLVGDSPGMTFDTRSKMLELLTLVLKSSASVRFTRRQQAATAISSSSSSVPSEMSSETPFAVGVTLRGGG